MSSVSTEEDLDALFDQIAAERDSISATETAVADLPTPVAAPASAGAAPPAGEPDANDMYQRIGHITRSLHDALRELGYDKKIAAAAQTLPDARDRLAYIATLTGQAADRVLSAVEVGQGVQKSLAQDSASLAGRWDALYAGKLDVEAFKALAIDTRAFVSVAGDRAAATNAQLHEIMMAQDFHDLTGQVIKRVGELAHTMESNLVALLIETRPADAAHHDTFLNGPAIGNERHEVMKNQEQVDQLLDALGF